MASACLPASILRFFSRPVFCSPCLAASPRVLPPSPPPSPALSQATAPSFFFPVLLGCAALAPTPYVRQADGIPRRPRFGPPTTRLPSRWLGCEVGGEGASLPASVDTRRLLPRGGYVSSSPAMRTCARNQVSVRVGERRGAGEGGRGRFTPLFSRAARAKQPTTRTA